MKQKRLAVLAVVLCVVTVMFSGCPPVSSGNLPGTWEYVAVDAASLDAPQFRALLTFGPTGSGSMGSFRYEEKLLLPDDDNGTMSWHTSYYAEGFYSTAPYGYPNESDIFTYWADTELNVVISQYAPVLVQEYNPDTYTYTYTLEPAPLDGTVTTNSHAVLAVNPFDQLVIAWGNRIPAPAGTMQSVKGFTINEGIAADTYVRISN